MKRFFSFGALLFVVALSSCQSHTSYDNSAGTSTAGTTPAAAGPETSAQQDQMAPRVDAPNNVGMPADSSTSQ